MKTKIVLLGVLIMAMTFTGCSSKKNTNQTIIGGADGPTSIVVSSNRKDVKEVDGYKQITQDYAKEIMDSLPGIVIIDAREQYEYDEGHIKGAILMPYLQTQDLAPDLVPDKDQTILIYCRSGRRSKIAAKTLSDMGYTNVLEFGGIIDWKYELEY